MMSLPEIEQRNRDAKADVDARVVQAERAKLADTYEKCFRKILGVLKRPKVWAEVTKRQTFAEFVEVEIEKVYKP
jgi:thioredoxin-like negative regulator of GroEL